MPDYNNKKENNNKDDKKDEYTEAIKRATEQATAQDKANDAFIKSMPTEDQIARLKRAKEQDKGEITKADKGEITQAEMDEKMAKIAEMMKKKGQ